jgi:hypothetical protein
MSILHLLQNTAKLYSPTHAQDAVGGDVATWALIGTYPCRIERLRGNRDYQIGRDNTEATHRVYAGTAIGSTLGLDDVMEIGNRQYKVIDFENLDPIISDSQLCHHEIDVKYLEQRISVT